MTTRRNTGLAAGTFAALLAGAAVFASLGGSSIFKAGDIQASSIEVSGNATILGGEQVVSTEACGSGSGALPVWDGSAWHCGSASGGGGGGSVSLSCGVGLSCSPSTITGTGTIDVSRLSLVTQEGVLVEGTIDNWNPTGLLTGIVQVTAADNSGTVIAGIDAVDNNIPIGRRITICTANGPQDDGVLAFAAEAPTSVANNRIWTPSYGRNTGQTSTDRYTLGTSACVDLIYMQPNQSDSTVKRWLIDDSTRHGVAEINLLDLYPPTNPPAITGTVNDWSGSDTTFGQGNGEAATNLDMTTRTTVLIHTVDSTGATITGLLYPGSGTPAGHGPVKMLCNMGPGPVTLTNLSGASAGTSLMYFGPGGVLSNVVLQAGDPCVMLWHQRDTGSWIAIGKRDFYFSGQRVTVKLGEDVSTTSTSVSPLTVVASATASVPALTVQGFNSSSADGLRLISGGASNYTAYTLFRTTVADAYFGVAGTSGNYMNGTVAGDVVIAANGTGRRLMLGTTLSSTPTMTLDANNNVELNGGQQIISSRTAMTASHGTLSSRATDWHGSITSIGANTSVTLTYSSAFAHGSTCFAAPRNATVAVEQILPSESASSVTFSCVAVATGSAANCDDFNYDCTGN